MVKIIIIMSRSPSLWLSLGLYSSPHVHSLSLLGPSWASTMKCICRLHNLLLEWVSISCSMCQKWNYWCTPMICSSPSMSSDGSPHGVLEAAPYLREDWGGVSNFQQSALGQP